MKGFTSHRYPPGHRLLRAAADWIRAVILRKTATPYECYWRDRAIAAERMAEDCRRHIRKIS